MRTLGILFVLVAAYLYRAAFIGRAVVDIPVDVVNGVKALFKGDTDSAYESLFAPGTLSLQGSESDPTPEPTGDVSIDSPTLNTGDNSGKLLAFKMQALGGAAKGYRLGSTGPVYYDCSGLVWRAMKDLGIYDGIRFSSGTMVGALKLKGLIYQVAAPNRQPGDLVVWPGHVGIMTDMSNVYSALNPKQGIGSLSLNGLNKSLGLPKFYRLKV